MPYVRFWKLCRYTKLSIAVLVSGCLWTNLGLASELPPADADAITIEAFPFGHAELDQLKRDGVVYIQSPNGTLRIALVAIHNNSQGERLDISVDGMPGTITRSGPGFFASLPSRNGSLRLENNGNSTRLVDEQILEQRNQPQLTDYRTPAAQ